MIALEARTSCSVWYWRWIVRRAILRHLIGGRMYATLQSFLVLGIASLKSRSGLGGDTTMATLDQVRAFAKGGSARIQR
jgi:hypothetical protein